MNGEERAVSSDQPNLAEDSRSWRSRLANYRWISWANLTNTKFGELFGIDLRSLAVLRMALALIMLADIAGRWNNLRVHYSDDGVLPRDAIMDTLNPWRWSVSFLNGTVDFNRALFIVTVIASISLLLGYRSRLMIVIVWIMLISFQIRNPFVLSAADLLLRMLLFWSMFLPLGAVWSIDALRRRDGPSPALRFLSVGTIGLLLQIAFMYWFTAILKSGAEWRSDGTALFYALSAEHLTTPFGEWAQQFDTMLRVLTFATLGIEVVAPILLFSPFLYPSARLMAIASLVGLHIGIWLTMNIGIFPWTSILCMLAFVPSQSWDWLTQRGGAWRRAMIGWSERLLDRSQARLDPVVGGALRPIQQGLVRMTGGALATDIGPVPVTAAGGATNDNPPELRSPATQSRKPLVSSWYANVAATCCLLLVFGWNVSTVSAFTMPGWTHAPVYTLALEQRWNMFAPRPPAATIWYAMVGTLRNGLQVEMLVPVVEDDMRLVQAFSWDQPENIASDYYHDKYWRKYFDAIGNESSARARTSFANYVCRSWNQQHAGGMQVETLALVIIADPTEPPGEPRVHEQGRSVLARFTCT